MKRLHGIIFFGLLLSVDNTIFCTSLDQKPFKDNFAGGQFSSEDFYKTCFYPYENSYLYAEKSLYRLFKTKKTVIDHLLSSGYISSSGITSKTDKNLKSLLDEFWSGHNDVVIEAKSHRREFESDFNKFMDRVFEEDYNPEWYSNNVKTLKRHINIISAIIDLSYRVYNFA